MSTASTTAVSSPVIKEATFRPNMLPTSEESSMTGTAISAASTAAALTNIHGHFFRFGGVQLSACCWVT